MASQYYWEDVLNVVGGNTGEMQVAALENGTFVVVWSMKINNDFSIFAQIYNADKSLNGPAFRVNSTNETTDGRNLPSQRRLPTVAALAEGGFAVAWVEHTDGTTGTDIRARVFDADGTPRADDFLAVKAPSGDQTSPRITSYGSGFVVSAEGYNNLPGISAGVFDRSGHLVKEVGLSGLDYESHSVAAIFDAPLGAVYAGMFISAALNTTGHFTEIALRAHSSTGVQREWALDVEPTASNVSVTALSGGRFVVAWMTYNANWSAPYVVNAVVFEADGTSSQPRLLALSEMMISGTVLAALPDGGFVLAYERGEDILGFTFDEKGKSKYLLGSVHADLSSAQTKPSVTVLADGRILVGWEGLSQGGAQALRAQILDTRDAVEWVGTDAGEQYAGTIHGDRIAGEAGADTLYGSKGSDTLLGGSGSDKLEGGEGSDWVSYASSAQGVNVSLADGRGHTGSLNGGGADANGDTYESIENVEGSNGGDLLIGDSAANHLRGLGSDDILQGGGGADTLDGGSGFNWASYAAATVGVTVNLGIPSQNAGDAEGDIYIDIRGLQGSNHNDRLIADATSAGNAISGLDGNDELIGRAGPDRLDGGNGNDTLNAGAGIDWMSGGSGNDTYYVEGADIIIEAVGQGYDTLITAASFTLAEGLEIESLIAGGGASINLVGNGFANSLSGNAGNDTLDGGAGNDMLEGGSGINTAVFSGTRSEYTIGLKAADGTVTVTGPDGTDVLKDVRLLRFESQGKVEVKALSNVVPVGLTLSKVSIVENAPVGAEVGILAATDMDGDAITYSLAPGSSSAFGIRGNSLVVTGSLDFETMPNHQVTIQAKDAYGGVTSLAITLTITNAIETTPFIIRGTPRADTLSGEAGNDTIYGGLSNDRLTGGLGKDLFVFDTRLNKRTNVDKILDFNVRDDSVYLENKIFTKLGSGSFSKPKKFKSDMFVKSNKAQDAEDRIVYDKKTGNLYYDKDGTGSAAQVKIATLSKNLKMTYADFFVI